MNEKNLVDIFKIYNLSTPYFSLNGQNIFGRLVDIYDGDTLKIILPVMDKYFKFDVRLNGIDTCEIKSNNLETKKKGLKARRRICEMIEEIYGDYDQIVVGDEDEDQNKFETKSEIKKYLNEIVCIVFVKCYEFDKYGRLLADVYINYEPLDKSISEILINEKLAYLYDGGKKLTEDEQLKIIK